MREKIKQHVIANKVSYYSIQKGTGMAWNTVRNYLDTDFGFDQTTELRIQKFLGL